MPRFSLGLLSVTVALIMGWSACASAAGLVIYTSRKDEMLKPLTDDFTKQTGITIQTVVDDTPQLIARLESEGMQSPADVLMPVDVAMMDIAAKKGLLMPTQSNILNSNVPEAYRDKEGRWYGLGRRARVIIYNKAKVNPSLLSTYEDLADPKWKGKLLVRSSGHAYNQSLLAAIIANAGEEKAQAWANGIAANLVRAPQGGDRDQIRAVAAGEGDVAIANSYYYARFQASSLPEDQEVARKTGLFFPNQNAPKGMLQGAHVNISGAGVVATSKQSQAALKFIEYLSGEQAQRFYADSNQEFPINQKVPPSKYLQGLGSFKADPTPLVSLSEFSQEAIRIADRSGWK